MRGMVLRIGKSLHKCQSCIMPVRLNKRMMNTELKAADKMAIHSVVCRCVIRSTSLA